MYALYSQIMSGFSSDRPLEYICGFLLFLVVTGVFFRFLYSIIKPY